MGNYEALLLKDAKEYIKYIIDKENKNTGSFDLLMRFFATSKEALGGYPSSELENRDFARSVYELLGWDNTHFDVINSFWTTFSWAMHIYNPKKYDKADAGNIKIYKNHYLNDKKGYEYDSFPEKYNKNDKETSEDVKGVLKLFPIIENLTALCHCVANFMPCPPPPFNQAKGTAFYLKDNKIVNLTYDYLPLMIDLIENATSNKNLKEQACYKENKLFYYADKYNPKVPITEDMIYGWKEWFIDKNKRESYCLQDYYDIENEKLKFFPLFKNQSLNNPISKKEEEIKECLKKILDLINTRAIRLENKVDRE